MKGFLFEVGRPTTPQRSRTGGARPKSGCAACGLLSGCQSSRMEPTGRGDKGIFILGKSPGKQEDERGRQFIGPTGDFLYEKLSKFGIEMDDDCRLDNCVQCFPRKHEVSDTNIKSCRTRVVKHIREFKPKLIITVGAEAIRSLYWPLIQQGLKLPGVLAMRGSTIPCREFDCWSAISLHPSFILRKDEPKDLVELFCRDLEGALELLEA
jgi:uracil-DNA glycosylase family 4